MTTSSQIVSSGISTNYRKTIQVDQVARNLVLSGFIITGLIFSIPGFWLMIALMDSSEKYNGWLSALAVFGFFGALALCMVGMFIGFIAWLMLENYWSSRNGKTEDFSWVTLLTMDDNGLTVEGLGTSAWQSILSYELIPDSKSALTVHTTLYGKLLLHDAVDKLIPVLDFHLERVRKGEISEAQLNIKTAEFNFKAIVFNWPRFFAWIITGYVFAIAVGFSSIIFNDNATFFKSIVAVVILMPICAWLVWTIPFWQLSYFSAGRTKAFTLKDDLLIKSDGSVTIDLKLAEIKYQEKSGLGYSLSFISIMPIHGKRLDLIIEAQEEAFLISKLGAIKSQHLN